MYMYYLSLYVYIYIYIHVCVYIYIYIFLGLEELLESLDAVDQDGDGELDFAEFRNPC